MSYSPLYDSCMASCARLDADHGCFETPNPKTGPDATGASVKQARVYQARSSASGDSCCGQPLTRSLRFRFHLALFSCNLQRPTPGSFTCYSHFLKTMM